MAGGRVWVLVVSGLFAACPTACGSEPKSDSGAAGRSGSAAGDAGAGPVAGGAGAAGGKATGGGSGGSSSAGNGGAAASAGGGASGSSGSAGSGGMILDGEIPTINEVRCADDVEEDGACASMGVHCLKTESCGADGCEHNVYRCNPDGLWVFFHRAACVSSCGEGMEPSACAIDQATGSYVGSTVYVGGTCGGGMLVSQFELEQGKVTIGDQFCETVEFEPSADGCSARSKIRCTVGDEWREYDWHLDQKSDDASILEGHITVATNTNPIPCGTYVARFDRLVP